MTRRLLALTLLTVLALANAAWLHDFAGAHDHDHDDAPTLVTLVCAAHTGETVVPVVIADGWLRVVVSYRLPALTSVPFVSPRRVLPPARAPAAAAAAPRAPPFA